MREKHCKKPCGIPGRNSVKQSWTCIFLWGNDDSFVMDFSWAKFIQNLSISQSLDGGTPKGKNTLVKYVFSCFLTHFFVALSCMWSTQSARIPWWFPWLCLKIPPARLFTCLACSALVPTWTWHWPKKRKERGKTWDDCLGALKMLRKIGDFFHKVSRWTSIIFFKFTYTYIHIYIYTSWDHRPKFWSVFLPMIQYGCQSFWAIDIPIFSPQDGESTWCWNWEQHTLIQLHTLVIFWTCGYQNLKPLVSMLEPHPYRPYLSNLPRRPCEVSSDSCSMEEMMKGALILRQFWKLFMFGGM